MSIQKFPLATIQKVRQYIKGILVLPESEQKISSLPPSTEDEPPEPDSLDSLGDLFKFGGWMEEDRPTPQVAGQWLISAVNPADALIKLPGLQLKPDFRLVSYLYRSESEGFGKTWALPEELSSMGYLEQALVLGEGPEQPPQPKGGMADFMMAIAGDRSPVSFLIASILRRELEEVGALGQYCNWTHHRLIETVPTRVTWQWRMEQPKDLSPKVRLFEDGRAAVEFFSCRVVAPSSIFRHVDQYSADQYTANSIDRSVAIAKR